MRASFFLAYALIGILFGVLALAYGSVFGTDTTSIDDVIRTSAIAGSAGALVLAGSNLSARLILKRLGIEIEVTVRKKDEDRRDG